MWCLALALILTGLARLAVEWLDEASEQKIREEADRQQRQADLEAGDL